MKSGKQERSCSEIIADFAANLRYEDIPAEVAARVKTHVLNAVGVGIAGSTMEWCQKAGRVFQRAGAPPEATVFGRKDKAAAPDAAIANGVAIASMDYDDTDYWSGGHHMSRSVVAAALAAGELAHASGREVIAAVAIGYDVAGRVGCSLLLDRYGPRGANPSWGPEDFAKNKVIQRQGGSQVRGNVPGLFACAAVAGRLLGLNAEQIASAQGLVGGFGLFLGQSNREGADATLLTSGWAAHAGVLAALWARSGLKGPRYIYEGDRGLLSVIGGDLQDASRLTENLGSQWNAMNNLLKFYPGAHGAHHFIESLKSLRTEHGLRAQDVEQIICHAPSQRVEMHFEPKEERLRPNPYSARFSLPYMLARLALDGELTPLSFTQEKVAEPALLELARRVTYVADDTVWFGEKRGLVAVRLRDGRTLTRATPELPGFPNRPYSRDDVARKFKACAALLIDDEKQIAVLLHALEALEEVKDVGDVMRLTA